MSRLAATALLLGCLIAYQLSGQSFRTVDAAAAPYIAWSVASGAGFDLRAYPTMEDLYPFVVRDAIGGERLSKYPPGSALAALPLIAPLAWLRTEPPSRPVMDELGRLVGAVYTALAALVILMLLTPLTPRAAMPAAALFAFGTSMWSVAAQALWAHGPATLCCAIALAALLSSRGRAAFPALIAASFALAFALWIRPQTVLFSLAGVAALLWQRRSREAALMSAVIAVAGALLAAYNFAYFDRLLAGGYGDEAELWSTPLGVGIAGLLISPSRGLFVFSPALVFAPYGAWLLSRARTSVSADQRVVLAAFAFAAVGLLVLFARWYDWWGGWGYGPRFLCEALPILVVLFALGCESALRVRAGRIAVTVLLGLSISIHAVGVFGMEYSWHGTHNFSDSMFELRDSVIPAHLRSLLRGGAGGGLP